MKCNPKIIETVNGINRVYMINKKEYKALLKKYHYPLPKHFKNEK